MIEVTGKGNISAKVIAASISGVTPICTLELHYPRFIHSEFMTHRVFSRNASSSRAIPVAKMIEQVTNKPAMPIHWGKNQSGMQARKEHNAPSKGIEEWYNASYQAVRLATQLNHHGFHKQIVNRILEPFQFIKVIVTATEWGNFFNLRLHPNAQPEIQELARCMIEAIDGCTPTRLGESEWIVDNWHLPYVKESERSEYSLDPETLIKLSVARCARVSYMNHDNSEPDIEKDIALHDKLLEAGHFSPFEHQATPIVDDISDFIEQGEPPIGITHIDRNFDLWSNNFRSWKQYRAMINV